jgi:hypothetical protein
VAAPCPGRHIRPPVLVVLFCPISIFYPVLPNLRKRKEFRPEGESASTKSKNAHAQLCLLMITTLIQLVSITPLTISLGYYYLQFFKGRQLRGHSPNVKN